MAEFKLGRLKFVWKGDWATSTDFVKDDIVRFGGRTYVCKTAHASTSFYADELAGKWELHTEGMEYVGDWTPSTTYKLRDIVKRGANTIICTTAHTAASTDAGYDATDSGYWEILSSGIEWKGEWLPSTYYKVNDLVRQTGGNTYLCNTPHTSGADLEGDYSNWDHFLEGFHYENTWNAGTDYQEGDVVGYGGFTYVSLTHNTNSNPSTNPSDWSVFTTGFKSRGDWAGATNYKIGDFVRHGGDAYVAIQDNTGRTPSTEPTYWELVVSGIRWVGEWSASSVVYKKHDAVKRGLSSYIAMEDHTSGAGNDPQVDNVTWNNISQGDSTDVLTTKGDLIYRNATQSARLPIGTPNQILIVDPADTVPKWVSSLNVTNITGGGNIDFDGSAYIGPNAATEVDGGAGTHNLTDASAILKGDVDSFVQVGLINANNGAAASSDLIVYADNGDNDSGWMDMGITSSGFDYTSGYGITKVNDGYLFMSAPVGTTGPGNMVIATNDTGAENDIVFCTGGFDITTNTDAEKMRIVGEPRVGVEPGVVIAIDTASTSPSTGALRVAGGIGLLGDLHAQGNIVVQGSISLYGGSTQFAAENLIVTNPVVFVGSTNPADAYDLGFVGEYANNTQLDGAILVGTTTIVVDSTTGFPTSGTIHIGSEQITYTGKTGTSFTGCTRGANGTTAAGHADNTAVTLTRYTGLIRDHLTKKWNFIQGLTEEPSTTTNLSNPNLTYAGLKIGSIEITDTTATTSFNTGAFTVQGGMGVAGDIYAGGKALFGNAVGGGAMGGATNPIAQFVASDNNYAQAYIYNKNSGSSASADLIAYPDNGADDAGFMDMGITSSTYSSVDFAVTGANEGYIFMSAPTGSSTSGNMIIATDSTGTDNDIAFFTNGFNNVANERFRIGSEGIFASSEVTVNSSYNITATKAPTVAAHVTNKTYVDTADALRNSTWHALTYDVNTGTMTYSKESTTTSGALSINQDNLDMAFINNNQATVSINASGHLIVTLA